MKIYKTTNSLKVIYANINDGDIIKKLEFKKIIVGEKHLFYNGAYGEPSKFMNCYNAVIIPNMCNMWENKKRIIESRINIYKKELKKKVLRRQFKILSKNVMKINKIYIYPPVFHFIKKN